MGRNKGIEEIRYSAVPGRAMKAKGTELLDIVALGLGVALYFEPVDFQIWLSKVLAYNAARQIEKEEKKDE